MKSDAAGGEQNKPPCLYGNINIVYELPQTFGMWCNESDQLVCNYDIRSYLAQTLKINFVAMCQNDQ